MNKWNTPGEHAHHEAAHWWVAEHLGLKVQSVTLNPPKCWLRTPPEEALDDDTRFKLACWIAAGYIGTKLYCGRKVPYWFAQRYSASDDMEYLERVRDWYGVYFGRADHLWLQRLIRKNWGEVQEKASILLDRGKVELLPPALIRQLY